MIIQNEIPFFEKAIHKDNIQMPDSHFHDKHELYYLKKGNTKYFIDNEIYLLEPGDMIFVPKNTFHKTVNLDTDYTERLLFTFDDNDIPKDFSPFIEHIKKNKFIKIAQNKSHHIQNLLTKVENEEEKMSIGYKMMQKLYFKELLILISRYSIEINHNEKTIYTVAEDISKYITDNYQTDLTLDNLAKRYSMSTSYLSRFFKNSTGVKLIEYINITRVTAAENLLINTDLSITEIANKCGFNDSNYFAAVFKKIKGITPKKFSLINKK